MHIKLRAVEVTLSNGETHIVHEPKMADFGMFLQALPSLTAVGKLMEAAQQAGNGVLGVAVVAPPEMVDGIAPLFSKMSDITVEEFNGLGVFDGMAILAALNEFVPKNLKAATLVQDSQTSTS